MNQYVDVPTDSEKEFVESAVEVITSALNTAIENDGHAIVGLSGGSTPRPIYEALGKQPIDWERVSIFLVDERYIDTNHAESNQKMIRDTLLKHANISERNICFPDTNLVIDTCAEKYAKELQAQWNEKLPDVLVLGMGPDGHIASLFPPLSNEALSDTSLVLHTKTDAFAVHDRITISLNSLAAANQHVFLLKGAEKIAVWKDMIESSEDERRWPAKRLLNAKNTIVVTCS